MEVCYCLLMNYVNFFFSEVIIQTGKEIRRKFPILIWNEKYKTHRQELIAEIITQLPKNNEMFATMMLHLFLSVNVNICVATEKEEDRK